MSSFGPVRFAIGFLSLVALGVFLAPRPASADVTYIFNAAGSLGGQTITSSFSFEVPTFITSTGTTTIASLLTESDTGTFFTSHSCGAITSVILTDPSKGGLLTPEVSEGTAGSCGATFTFTIPFDTLGTFVAADGTSSITIQGSPTLTPEPAPLLLLGTGLLGLGVFVRRAALA
jgi:hypothetical protein